MIRLPPRSTPLYSSAASDVYKRQEERLRLELGQRLPERGHVGAAQVGVHAPGGLLALGDRLDGRLGAEYGVAAGEHPRVGGLEGPVVNGDRAPLGALDALLLGRAVELGVLADRRDDLVALNDELAALDGHGAAAAGGVGLAELHAQHLDAGDLVGGVGKDAHGRAEQLQLDALLLGLVDLGVVGGHLLARPAVQAGDLFGALAHGSAAGVHSGKAAADDGNIVPDVDPVSYTHLRLPTNRKG